MTGPGPLEVAVLAELGGGPRLAVDIAEAVGRGIHVVGGMLRELERRGVICGEADRSTGIWHWHLRDRGAA